MAQPVITSAFNPQAGDTFIYHITSFTANLSAIGPEGANVVWDFSNIATTSIISGRYQNVPICNFPNSSCILQTIVVDPNYPDDYNYYGNQQQFSFYEYSGFKFEGYDDAQDILRYPMAYQTVLQIALLAVGLSRKLLMKYAPKLL